MFRGWSHPTALDDPEMPGELLIAARVASGCGREFNSGRPELLSGRTRQRGAAQRQAARTPRPVRRSHCGRWARRATMTIRTKAAPRKSVQLDSSPAAWLLMTYATQQHFDHGHSEGTRGGRPTDQRCVQAAAPEAGR
jgi:hypothetical protein